MKKYIVLFIVMACFYIGGSNALEKEIIIPDDSLRIRVIPNSNKEEDQILKNKVKENLQVTMYELLKETEDIEEARKIINKNLNVVDKEVKQVLLKENYHQNYDIKFGKNYFPEKEYKGVTYKEGYYESLVVKLGKGEGDNWWCVLYPPLCLVEDETNYKSLVEEILSRYF